VSGECLACGIPHVIAPDLIAWTGEGSRTAVGKNSLKHRRNSNKLLRFLKPKSWTATDMPEPTP